MLLLVGASDEVSTPSGLLELLSEALLPLLAPLRERRGVDTVAALRHRQHTDAIGDELAHEVGWLHA